MERIHNYAACRPWERLRNSFVKRRRLFSHARRITSGEHRKALHKAVRHLPANPLVQNGKEEADCYAMVQVEALKHDLGMPTSPF